MIFITTGGNGQQRNNVVSAIAQLSDKPVYRRSVMNVPLMILKKSPRPEAQYVNEIFHSYIGDVLQIDSNRNKDVRVGNPGDNQSEPGQTISSDDAALSALTIAEALTSGVDPLFLFNLTLKNVGRNNFRHHVFVDLQYHEELDRLMAKNEDTKIVIVLKDGKKGKQDIVPDIKGLTPLKEEDLNIFEKIELTADLAVEHMTMMLSKAKCFKEVEGHVHYTKEVAVAMDEQPAMAVEGPA